MRDRVPFTTLRRSYAEIGSRDLPIRIHKAFAPHACTYRPISAAGSLPMNISSIPASTPAPINYPEVPARRTTRPPTSRTAVTPTTRARPSRRSSPPCRPDRERGSISCGNGTHTCLGEAENKRRKFVEKPRDCAAGRWEPAHDRQTAAQKTISSLSWAPAVRFGGLAALAAARVLLVVSAVSVAPADCGLPRPIQLCSPSGCGRHFRPGSLRPTRRSCWCSSWRR